MSSPQRRRFILLTILAYALFSAAWIVLSDQILTIIPSKAMVTALSTTKGLLFVLISATFLAWAMLCVPDRERPASFPGLDLDPTSELGASGWRRDLLTYVWATLLSLAAISLRLVVPVHYSERPLLVLFLFPVIVSAFLGGTGPGLLSTFMVCLATLLLGSGISDLSSLQLFHWMFLLSNGLLISLLSGVMHRSRITINKDRQILALTVNSLDDALVATDPRGQVVYTNAAAEALLELPSQEAIGKSVQDVLPVTGEGELRQLELAGKPPIPIRLRTAPITLVDGRQMGKLWIVSDERARLNSELAIREERQRLRTLIDSMSDLVWVKDVQGRFQICNPMFERFVGVKEADLIGKSDYDLVPADQADFFRANDRMALLSGASRINTEWLTMADDGRSILVETVKTPVLGKDGVPVAIMGVARDITASWQTQQRLSLALAAAHMGVWEWNLRSDQLLWSPECARITGMDKLEMLFEEFRRIVHPDDVAAAMNAARMAVGQGDNFRREVRVIRPDGEIRWLSIHGSPHYDDAGLPLRMIGTVSDITEQKNTTEELERHRHHLEDLVAQRSEELLSAERRFGLILDSSADGMLGIDLEGNITFINPAGCRILGYDKDSVIGQSAHTLIHHHYADGSHYPVEDCPVITAIREGQEVRHARDLYWRADGTAVPVSSATHPMMQNGKVIGAVVSFSDISTLVAADQARDKALAEAERLAGVRREFLANMSHEIRTPLNAILGLAHIGSRECSGRKSQVSFQRIIEAGHTLLGVVNDVLDFSKIEAGQMRLEQVPMTLAGVVDQSLLLVSGRGFDKGLTLLVDEDPALPSAILGDSLRLSQVVGNLLSNAVKFTPSGGVVRLSLGKQEGMLVIRVEDSGIGITEEQMSRLFRPFEQADGSTTRHFGGTGLGLSITHNLVELMGGSISVTSKQGLGSRFTVELPMNEVEPPRRSPCDGVIALLGLEADEGRNLQSELLRRGAVVEVADRPDQVPTGALVVLPSERLVDAEGAALRQSLPLGCRILAVVTPGHGLEWDQSVFGIVERPLRARQVVMTMCAPCAAFRPLITSTLRLAGLSFLVAEDNEINRLVMHELLESEGAKVISAENGSKALAILSADGASRFDMLLTDIQMPDFDGYELARRVSRMAPDLPIIGVTAHAMPEERQRCLEAGMVAHVTKPVDPTQLFETVLRHVRAEPGHYRPAIEAGDQAAPPQEDGEIALGIDWEALQARYQGKPSFIAKLLQTVVSAQQATSDELRHAAENGDLPRLAFLAHGLKGSAGNLMADGLRRLAMETEHSAREGQADDASALARRLAEALDALLADIRQHQPQEAT